MNKWLNPKYWWNCLYWGKDLADLFADIYKLLDELDKLKNNH